MENDVIAFFITASMRQLELIQFDFLFPPLTYGGWVQVEPTMSWIVYVELRSLGRGRGRVYHQSHQSPSCASLSRYVLIAYSSVLSALFWFPHELCAIDADTVCSLLWQHGQVPNRGQQQGRGQGLKRGRGRGQVLAIIELSDQGRS